MIDRKRSHTEPPRWVKAARYVQVPLNGKGEREQTGIDDETSWHDALLKVPGGQPGQCRPPEGHQKLHHLVGRSKNKIRGKTFKMLSFNNKC